MTALKKLTKACTTLKNSLSAFVGKRKKAMFSSQGSSDHAVDSGMYGQNTLTGVITGSQAAAMQNAAYNAMLQNVHTTSNPNMLTGATSWKDRERSAPSVGINIERASNGYIIRSNGSSILAMTLEDVQQHVTAIVVSNLVME
jgi:hypothetical protein